MARIDSLTAVRIPMAASHPPMSTALQEFLNARVTPERCDRTTSKAAFQAGCLAEAQEVCQRSWAQSSAKTFTLYHAVRAAWAILVHSVWDVVARAVGTQSAVLVHTKTTATHCL